MTAPNHMNKDCPRIALLMTGNELMTGDIVDSNSAMLSERFLDSGFSVHCKVTIPDDMDLLVSEITRLSLNYDIVLMNGGLGPTSDDLTAQALALAADVPTARHPLAYAHLEAVANMGFISLSPANLKQAELPEGCDIIPNSMGTAVGFALTLNGCRILCTPGVPRELKVMFQNEILPMLEAAYPARIQPARTRMKVFGMGESGLQQLLDERLPDWPEGLEVGFRASMPLLELKLQLGDRHQQSLLASWESRVAEVLGGHLVTKGAETLPEIVCKHLREQGKRFTCAESCTGGLVASQMTAIPGVSELFEAGFVTYSNTMKESILGVSHSNLVTHGAVSEAVVREMLLGALQRSAADVGVAISGIAGPGGGSEDKPVGLVWIAWGSEQRMNAAAFQIPGNRQRFQLWVTAMAFDLTRRFLCEIKDPPHYFKERAVKLSLSSS